MDNPSNETRTNDQNIGEPSQKRARINVAEDVNSDPARRKKINDYEPNERDDIRRKYVQIGPCQPISYDFPRTEFGDRKRCFQKGWFTNREWLEYSFKNDAAFCFWCYLFGDGRFRNEVFTKGEIFYQVVDHIIQEMGNRFSESSTELLLCIACLDPKKLFSSFSESRVFRLAELYPLDFSLSDRMELKEELKIWICDMRENETFCKLQNLGDVAKKMVEVRFHTTFPLVYRLIELILVFPVATATVERVFSAMNIIKMDLRNKMGDDFLTDCLVCYVEKDVFISIDNEVIMQHYQNMRTRRIDLPRLRNGGH